jgi:FeS assembly SUF system protein
MDDTASRFEFDPPAEARPEGGGNLADRVMDAMRTVYDPEIPVNLVELGLIYDLNVDDDGKVAVEMTLTTPSCPVAGNLPGEVQRAIEAVEGVTGCTVELVWTPPWGPQMMTEAAKLELGFL